MEKSLAEMIRQDKVHIILYRCQSWRRYYESCSHNSYKRVPNYRDLSPQDEWDLLENHYNRVTDTCIPEEEAFRRLQTHLFDIWNNADSKGERYFPSWIYVSWYPGASEQYYE
jgi:deoxyhypusine synthase